MELNLLEPTNDFCWQTLHESSNQYHHSWTSQSLSMDQTCNIINWQTLFTCLWRWLSLTLSKRQSPTTVLFRTTLTRTITQYELLIYSWVQTIYYETSIYSNGLSLQLSVITYFFSFSRIFLRLANMIVVPNVFKNIIVLVQPFLFLP